jgi:hypothetical protein
MRAAMRTSSERTDTRGLHAAIPAATPFRIGGGAVRVMPINQRLSLVHQIEFAAPIPLSH